MHNEPTRGEPHFIELVGAAAEATGFYYVLGGLVELQKR